MQGTIPLDAARITADPAAAAAIGRAEAASFDDALRRRELVERDELRLLSSRSCQGGLTPAAAAHKGTLSRLQREEAELLVLYTAICDSRAWRAAEALRRLVGRSWSAAPERGRRASLPFPAREAAGDLSSNGAGEIAMLEKRVEELAAFLAAVSRSRAWRVIQAMRRVAGRQW